jgi:hypothetical protein
VGKPQAGSMLFVAEQNDVGREGSSEVASLAIDMEEC